MPRIPRAIEIAVDMPDTASLPTQPDMLCHLLDSVLAGHDVTLFIRGDGGRELLDAAAERLPALRCRVLRAAGTPSEGLSLPLLLAQVTMGQGTWHPVPSAQNDEFLRRSFQALTVLDGTCDRIVLLVSDANALQPAALRYIQLACRAGASLQLVLAGKRGFLDLLSPAEFADLRARLATGPIITPLPPGPAVLPAAFVAPQRPRPIHETPPVPAPEQVEFEPSRPMLSSFSNTSHRKRLAALAGIGLGVAACVALAVWTHGSGAPPAMPSQQAALTVEMPMVPAAPVPATPDTPPVSADAPAPDVPLQPPAASQEPAAPEQPPAPEQPAALQQPAAPQEASVPVAPLLAAPPSATTSSPPKNPVRKTASTQPRALAARAPTLNAGNVAAWEDPYPAPPRNWRPMPPQAVSDPPDQPKSYIGTYTTDSNGVRAFRFGH